MHLVTGPRLGRLFALAAFAAMTVSAVNAEENLSRDLTLEQKDIAGLSLPPSDLQVAVWMDRSDESYRPGEAVQIFVRTNRDAYVTVIDVGSSGKVYMLFPNRYAPDNRVQAHRPLQIPAPGAPYRIRAEGPAGHELLKVFATTERRDILPPEALPEAGPFRSYIGNARGLSRDLSITFMERPDSNGNGVAQAHKVLRILAGGTPLPQVPAPGGAPGAGSGPGKEAKPGGVVTPEDLFRLGMAAANGRKGEPEHGESTYREAARLFAAAADAGHVGAMFQLGRLYEEGRTGSPDPVLALHWYGRAAELGNTPAMLRLATIYAAPGVGRNRREALRWLKKAAEQGDGAAMLNLAHMYDAGMGLVRAPRQAAQYVLRALKSGAWTALDQAGRLSDETRREIQAQLRHAGFYGGPLDGAIGSETRAAMAAYAKAGA